MEFTRDELKLIRQLVQAYVAWLYANGSNPHYTGPSVPHPEDSYDCDPWDDSY